jgi:hypothetical protein
MLSSFIGMSQHFLRFQLAPLESVIVVAKSMSGDVESQIFLIPQTSTISLR